jgi:FdhD protein
VIRPVSIHRFENGAIHRAADCVAIEEPLEIRIREVRDGKWTTQAVAVTMRTPGADDELAVGFLYSESIVNSGADIARIEVGGERGNEVTVELRSGVDLDWGRLKRNFYTTSSCGVCGKASLEGLEIEDAPPLPMDFGIAPELIASLPGRLREAQPDFAATGGLHAAGLFSGDGGLLAAREDVGRHNATDKLIGHGILAGFPGFSENVLVLSGRASFELLQKAWRARIGVVAAVGAPSSLAVELAERFGITLVGFVRESRFNVYSHPQRVREEHGTGTI